MITWSESVKKEKSAIKIYENFTINPKNNTFNLKNQVFTLKSPHIHWKTHPKHNYGNANEGEGWRKKPFSGLKATENFNWQRSFIWLLYDFLVLSFVFFSEDILSKLSSINDSPKKKFTMPMTANQEIGWHTDVKN